MTEKTDYDEIMNARAERGIQAQMAVLDVLAALRKRMDQLGWTYKDLINDTGMQYNTLHDILSADTQITVKQLFLLFDVLGFEFRLIEDEEVE